MSIEVGTVIDLISPEGMCVASYLYLGRYKDNNYPKVKGPHNKRMWLNVTGIQLRREDILPTLPNDMPLTMPLEKYTQQVIHKPDAKVQQLVAVVRSELSELK